RSCLGARGPAPASCLPLHAALPIFNEVAQAVGKAVLQGFGASRAGYLIAGFEVPHTHIHVFPANDMSGFDLSLADPDFPADKARSEEHTSELQSRFDLVCRLLLEQQ